MINMLNSSIDIQKHYLHDNIPCLFINIPWLKISGISIYFRGGEHYCSKEKPQMAHLFEHLSMRGPDGKTDQFIMDMESHGVLFNASIHRDWILFNCRFPSEHIQHVIAMYRQILFGDINWREEHVQIERKVIRSELQRQIRQPSWRLTQYLKHVLYPDLYTNYTIEQQIQQLDTITLDDMMDFRQQYIQPHNAYILIFGPEPSQHLTVINKLFPNSQSHYPINWPKAIAQQSIHQHTIYVNQPITLAAIGNVIPPFANLEREPITLLYGLLVYGMGGYLYQKAVLEAGLTYHIQTDLEFRSCYGIGILYAQLLEPTGLDQFNQLIHQAFETLCNGEITNAQLQRARERYLTNLQLQYENPEMLVRFIGKHFLYTSNLFELEYQINLIRSASINSLTELAQRYFSFDQRLFVAMKAA